MGEKYFSNEIVGFLHPALALSPKQYFGGREGESRADSAENCSGYFVIKKKG